MKKQMSLLAIFLMVLLVSSAQAQLIWRSAATLKKGQAIAMASNYLTPFNRSYDWTSKEWVNFPSGKASSWHGSNTMFGVGLTSRLELLIHAPIDIKASENNGVEKNALGLGDVYVKARYAVIPWSQDKAGFTVLAAYRLPTGDEKAEIALGDGTKDVGFGAIFATPKVNGFLGHLRASYWLNGETDAKVNLGDELQVIAKLDKAFSAKWVGFISYTFGSFLKSKDADGEAMDNTQKTRHYLSPGVVWKPIKGLCVRPKVVIPLAGQGGSLFGIKPLLDVWYTFGLFQ